LRPIYERALWLCKEFDIQKLDEDDTFIPFVDPRLGVIEHVCHELAHAALLGLLYGPNLPERISRTLKRRDHSDPETPSERNEVETFAVVMEVFERLRFSIEEGVMLDAAGIQVNWQEIDIENAWESFRGTTRCHEAADRVSFMLDRRP